MQLCMQAFRRAGAHCSLPCLHSLCPLSDYCAVWCMLHCALSSFPLTPVLCRVPRAACCAVLCAVPCQAMCLVLVPSWLRPLPPTQTVRTCGWQHSNWSLKTASPSAHGHCWPRYGNDTAFLLKGQPGDIFAGSAPRRTECSRCAANIHGKAHIDVASVSCSNCSSKLHNSSLWHHVLPPPCLLRCHSCTGAPEPVCQHGACVDEECRRGA